MTISTMMPADVKAMESLDLTGMPAGWQGESLLADLNLNYSLNLVAKGANGIVGILNAHRVGTEAHLNNIFVLLEYRKTGIGKALINMMLKRFEGGISRITLEVRQSNTNAKRFYLENEFIVVGKRPNFYENPREDAVIMERIIKR